ncbi:MAG: PH domain-containing protein [Muribaculaceae bacterium]|nr:PH domain-containing protein [Muribaculaceae bacterium]
MNINKILANGEQIIYRPRLHGFAYFNLARLVRNLTTTIFLSDRRFFCGHGLLRRHTHEMVIAKVETINVTESLAGRIFGYGTVYVSGTGAGSITMRYIRKPFELQRQIRSIQS